MNNNALAVRKIPRVVLLEEERSLSRLFEQCLHDWFEKLDLLTFENGKEASEELSRRSPDLLILDSAYPGLTENEILHQFAVEQVKCPVLLISEFFEQHVQLFSDAGWKFGFLSKPFGVREFWEALNQLVGPSDHPELQALVQTQAEIQLSG